MGTSPLLNFKMVSQLRMNTEAPWASIIAGPLQIVQMTSFGCLRARVDIHDCNTVDCA